MRKKTDAVDYKYFREPNIVPIDLAEDFIQDAIMSMNKLPNQYREELKAIGLGEYEIGELHACRKTNVWPTRTEDLRILDV